MACQKANVLTGQYQSWYVFTGCNVRSNSGIPQMVHRYCSYRGMRANVRFRLRLVSVRRAPGEVIPHLGGSCAGGVTFFFSFFLSLFLFLRRETRLYAQFEVLREPLMVFSANVASRDPMKRLSRGKKRWRVKIGSKGSPAASPPLR